MAMKSAHGRLAPVCLSSVCRDGDEISTTRIIPDQFQQLETDGHAIKPDDSSKQRLRNDYYYIQQYIVNHVY